MTVERLLNMARAEIGTTEHPANSNNVKYNTWYYGQAVHDGLWGTTFPWCMAFVQWVFHQTGTDLPYKTASCNGLLNWYKQYQPQRVVTMPKPGDIIIYTFSHTGIVESVGGTTITAIEGNTSSSESGSQSNGGGVFRKVRSQSSIKAYIRAVDFESAVQSVDATTREENMTREQILEKLGDQYIITFEELPEWAKPDMRELLDNGVINGGTDASVDPNDIHMFLSDIKTIIVTKRMMAK